jgi:proteasome alpha subunit
MKPLEIEILVAEVGSESGEDALYHILYDGTVMDERNFSVLGGEAETIEGRLEESWSAGLSLADALGAAVKALAGPDRTLAATDLEVAVLERGAARRAFRRLTRDEVTEIVPEVDEGDGEGGDPDGGAKD